MDTSAPSRTTLPETSFAHPRFADPELLGEGSMGRVYRAFDRRREEVVAVKTVPRLAAEEIFWLKNEFRSLADVRHPGLAELHELVADQERCFFTMELVDGVDFLRFADRLLGPERVLSDDMPQAAILRDCVAQLVRGIRAVHRAGKLHRDIKPSNVLVTREGRVVLLDFGLTTPVRVRGPRAATAAVVSGTPLYMSPEQAEAMPLSPKSDWYSLGVLLYEALTGRAPFSGSYAEMLVKKRRRPPDPRERRAGLPPPLAALVTSLLEPEPADRPDDQSILETLGGDALREPSDALPGWFIGRQAEIRELYLCLERARHAAVVVHVQGDSGIGKSALLERWCDRLEVDERALVLRSRCHPRESLPFKALDGAMDALSQYLAVLPAHELDDAGIDALLRLFPILARVPAVSAAPHAEPRTDPFEARRHGAEALKCVLRCAARAQPVVLWIDDLQWGDLDSLWVVRALLRPPDPPPLLVLLSYRGDAAGSALLADLAREPLESSGARRVDVELEALPDDESETLARLLLTADAPPEASRVVARDAAGSPFYIRELALHQRSGDGASALEQVIQERVAALDPAARGVLATVALATGPVDADVALRCATAGGAPYRTLALLQGAGFVRVAPLGERQALQPAHDRVREAVLATLDPAEQRRVHAALAVALATLPEPDPETLFHHLREAGEHAAAARHAEDAGDRAARALAFERAAALYEAALALEDAPRPRSDLVLRLAEALENGGRTADAAHHYLRALALADEAPDARTTLELRRRAAVCFMKSGHLAQGRRELWAVLAAVGVEPPTSQRDAIRRTMQLRVPLLLQRADHRWLAPRAAPDVRTGERLAALWGATTSFVMTEQHTAAYVGVHFVRAALAAGSAPDVARAILHEAACEGALRFRYFRTRAHRLLANMEHAAELLDDAYVRAYVLSVRASNEWENGRFRLVVELFERAHAILTTNCRNVSWEAGVMLNFSFNAQSYLGRMRALLPRLEAELEAARDRGDVMAMNYFRLGQASFARVAAGQVERALELAAQARASMPAEPFDIPHYHHLMLVVQCHLYRGDAVQAWRSIDDAWPRLRAAQFLQIAFPRLELLHLRARCALALLASPTGTSGKAPGRSELRRLVQQSARRIRRSDAVPAAPLADALQAGLAALDGDRDRLRRRLQGAAEGFRAADMQLHRDATLCALASVLGGSDEPSLRARALARMASEVDDPLRLGATLLPAVLGH